MYFEGIKTIEELKEEFRRLAFLYHPDIGGNEEIFKSINNEYDDMLNSLKDKDTFKSESQQKESDNFKDIISKIIHIKDDISTEVCGLFLWISGNTKPHKELFKSLGFYYSSKKKAWYYKPSWYRGFNKQEWTMEEIRNSYGSQKVKTDYEKDENKKTYKNLGSKTKAKKKTKNNFIMVNKTS